MAQENMPSDTPIDDDMDDLYGDTPAIPQYRQETSTPPTVIAAPQYPPPHLQYSNVQLPGLSSTTKQWDGVELGTNAHIEAIPIVNEPADGQQTLDRYRSEQHSQNGCGKPGTTNGLYEAKELFGQASTWPSEQHEVPETETTANEGAASSGTQPTPSKMSADFAINAVAASYNTSVPITASQEQGQDVEISGEATRHASQDQQPEHIESMDTALDGSGSHFQYQTNQQPNRQEGHEQNAAASTTKAPSPEDTAVIATTKIPEKDQIKEAEPGKSFSEVNEANKDKDEAEFELDSSPIESSSEEESDSSTSSSGDSDYEMLDAEEEARRLMQEDGGSDDEGKGGKSAAEPLRTLNEKPEDIIPKPQIEVTPAMSILELGNVEHVVEDSILIKGKNSGESRALLMGSLLCLANRSVIGVIAEVLGQVQQPYYSVRFTNAAAIAESGISKGTPTFYVEQHSTYVFTQSLKALRGSDASNMHDEEVGDDEMEFSDDEAEAEYKRRVKQEKLARKGGRGGREDGFSKPARGGRGGRRGGYPNQHLDARNGAEPPPINYDDNNDGDDLYTPLARPSNLHEIMGRGEAPQEDLNSRSANGIASGSQGSQPGRPDRGRERGRGRGDRGGRGRGRGGRGDRRAGGGFQRDSRDETEQHDDNHQSQHHQPQQQHALPSPVHAEHYPSFPPQDYNGYQPPQPSSTWSTPTHWPYNNNTNTNNNTNNFSLPSYQPPMYAYQQQQHSYQNYNPYQHPQSPSPYPQTQYPPPQYNNNNNNVQAAAAHSPTTTTSVPPNIPAGAHINPAFFAAQAQQQQQQGYGNPPPPPPPYPAAGGGGSRSPGSEDAFRAAQEKLDLLRELSRSAGGGGGM
ncbi:MAG: hypothetical protein Q9202_002227 [Teloschistes flavicans]